MAQIKKSINKEKDLTILNIIGDLHVDQIIDLVDQTYASEITMNILWDLSEADTSSLTPEQIERIVNYSKQYSHLRKGGKTAYVSQKDIDFGLARVYQAQTQITGHLVSHGVFRTISEAMAWLEEDESNQVP